MHLKGYIFSILAALGFGSSPFLASYVFACDITPLMLGFMRVLFMTGLFAVIVLVRRGDSFRITGTQAAKTVFLALTGGVLTTAFLFKSYTCIDTSTATTLNFSYPVFVLLLGVLIYKEKLTRSTLVSFLLCVVGILMFCNPQGSFTWRGFFLALGSGITYGVYVLYIDKSHILEDMRFYPFTFYFFLFSSLIYLPVVLAAGEFSFSMTARGWVFAILFALDSGILATVFFQLGVQDIGSRKASILAAMEPVTSMVLGTAFLGEKLTIFNIIGVICVLASTTVLVVFGSREDEGKELTYE